MSELGDSWRQLNEESKNHRTQKQEWTKELIQKWCNGNGVKYSEIQPWHVRLQSDSVTLDIYPQRNKWHNVSKNTRGEYWDLIHLLTKTFQDGK